MIIEILLGILVLAEGYVIWNLTRKTELLETWVEDFTLTIDSVNNEIKLIDARGGFESDDETGAIFKQIQQTVEQLNRLRGEDVDDK